MRVLGEVVQRFGDPSGSDTRAFGGDDAPYEPTCRVRTVERSNERVNGGAASTLLDVLLGAAREAPGQTVVHVRGDGGEHTVTFAELHDDALRVAGGLLAAGVTPGTPLPLVADRGDAFQPMFWGALAAGAVPVPLAPEPRRIGPVWELLGRPPWWWTSRRPPSSPA